MLTLPPDFTFLVQLGTFFVLLLVLSRLLFAPFLEVLRERDERTTGDIEKAAAAQAEIAGLSAKVDADLARARASASAEVEAARLKTREEAARLLAQAQSEAAARLAELRGEVATATRDARTSLAADARTIADAMVTAVLGNGAVR